jgi:M6 family metalloprotease-like protein
MIIRTAVFFPIVITLGLAPLTFAQEAAPVARMRALNDTVLKHHELAAHSAGNLTAGLRSQAAIDIQRREAALASLIETDPDSALNLAFSPDLLDSMRAAFPDSAAHFETQRTWTGSLQTAVEDDLDLKTAKTINRLITGGGALNVYLSGNQPQPISGQMTVEGVEALGNIAARSLKPAVATPTAKTPAGATGSGTTGPQNIVTILVNLPGYKLPANVTADFMKGVLYGNANAVGQNTPNWYVDDFWQQNSDGQTSAPFASGLVVGPYTLTSNYTTSSTGASFCNYLAMEQDVINAANAAVNFLDFNRVVIVMPDNGVCTWTGISGIGYWSATTANGTAFTASFHWLRADTMTNRQTGVQLTGHELGHGFGLNHARTRAYPGPPAQALGAINAPGVLVEYGDPFAIMAAWNFGFYSAKHEQEILGWFSPSNYANVQTSGTYTINNYEARNASGMLKALRVLRDAASNSWIWIEFHTNTGNYDSQLPSQLWSGALIHYEDASTGAYTNLLDFTPATSGVFTDAALAAGQTWVDPYTNLSIAVGNISTTSTGSTLGVTVNYGVAGCTHASPTVSLSPSNPTVTAGGSTSLTVTVKSNNAAACPAAAYSLTAVQPSGFTGTLSTTSLTLAGGASGTAALSETAGTSVGTFALSVNATDTTDTADVGTGTTNITTAAACVTANPSVSLSPSAVTLAAGASSALTVTLKNNNSSACAAASFNLTAVQPTGFTGTFSKASITSLASGASTTATITEKAGTASGAFPLSVTGTNASTATLFGSGTATLTVPSTTCTLANPVVTITEPNGALKAGASVAWTISVKNTNSSACAASTFNLSAVQPTGFTGQFSVSSLTVASGATGTATLTEVVSKTTGSYSVTVTATSGTYAASAVGTATVSASASAKIRTL